MEHPTAHTEGQKEMLFGACSLVDFPDSKEFPHHFLSENLFLSDICDSRVILGNENFKVIEDTHFLT